jgi:hypothetical protein
VKTRLAASIALAAALLVGTAGCTLGAHLGTLANYQPSDGVGADVGSIKVRNLIALSDNGEDVSLLMTVVNAGDRDAKVNFQYENADGDKVTLTATVDAHSSVGFGASGEDELVLRDAGATVGGLYPVYVQSGDEPGKQLQVPVLDGGTAAYSDLLPSPAPSPTPTPTPTPSETPAA